MLSCALCHCTVMCGTMVLWKTTLCSIIYRLYRGMTILSCVVLDFALGCSNFVASYLHPVAPSCMSVTYQQQRHMSLMCATKVDFQTQWASSSFENWFLSGSLPYCYSKMFFLSSAAAGLHNEPLVQERWCSDNIYYKKHSPNTIIHGYLQVRVKMMSFSTQYYRVLRAL